MPSTLATLPKNTLARIVEIRAAEEEKSRLLALGLMEGLELRVMHVGPFGGDPLAVEVEGHMLALRRADAQHILLEESAPACL